jgi:hypothetical protein
MEKERELSKIAACEVAEAYLGKCSTGCKLRISYRCDHRRRIGWVQMLYEDLQVEVAC